MNEETEREMARLGRCCDVMVHHSGTQFTYTHTHAHTHVIHTVIMWRRDSQRLREGVIQTDKNKDRESERMCEIERGRGIF